MASVPESPRICVLIFGHIGKRIQYTTKNKPNAVSVPLSAVGTDSKGAPRVWVVDKENSTVSPQPVTLGPVRSKRIVVLEGLKKGETIVTAGTRLLREGARVHAVERF